MMETEASGRHAQPQDRRDAPGPVQHLVDPNGVGVLSRNEATEDRLIARKQMSPLRYPGGKRRLVPYVQAMLKANDLRPDLFVEPFAGGASVALELAATGAVDQIGLADRDPYIAAFWETVFFDCDWLCRQVEQVEVTLGTWERMKKTRFRSRRSLALACLFLNRTSFNGTLQSRAGPIGGKNQVSRYGIDCRFPRKRLIQRLRTCEQLATEQRVAFVESGSALNIIGRECLVGRTSGESVFFYLDPPFWAKSRRLYRFSFSEDDHSRLAEALRYVREPFLLSYDLAPEIEALYSRSGLNMTKVELLYVGTARSAETELVITNLPELPTDTRLWRTTQEWRDLRRPVTPTC